MCGCWAASSSRKIRWSPTRAWMTVWLNPSSRTVTTMVSLSTAAAGVVAPASSAPVVTANSEAAANDRNRVPTRHRGLPQATGTGAPPGANPHGAGDGGAGHHLRFGDGRQKSSLIRSDGREALNPGHAGARWTEPDEGHDSGVSDIQVGDPSRRRGSGRAGRRSGGRGARPRRWRPGGGRRWRSAVGARRRRSWPRWPNGSCRGRRCTSSRSTSGWRRPATATGT